MRTSFYSRAFTIVELLIVVVVIAILSAIALVSYNGITTRATEATLKSELSTAVKQLGIDNVSDGQFPIALEVANSGNGIESKDDVTFRYYSSGKDFCLSATPQNESIGTFYINQEGTVGEGYCPATNEACFAFDPDRGAISNYYDHQNNDSNQPACPRDVFIPRSIGGVTVTTILGPEGGNPPSLHYKGLTSIVVPDTVTAIGHSAFSDNPLTYIDFPSSVEDVFLATHLCGVRILHLDRIVLGQRTIDSGGVCGKPVKEVYLRDSVVNIGSGAFAGTGLTQVRLPESLVTITGGAFADNLFTAITIPESVTTLDPGVFWGNPIASVRIPSHLDPIHSDVFDSNPEIIYY